MESCKKCLHVEVCGKYAATGGRVRNCKHMLEPKRGRWIRVGGGNWRFRCSLCGAPHDADHDFCPDCGANMIGGDRNGQTL